VSPNYLGNPVSWSFVLVVCLHPTPGLFVCCRNTHTHREVRDPCRRRKITSSTTKGSYCRYSTEVDTVEITVQKWMDGYMDTWIHGWML
jgi:hypothetical protein